MEAQGGYDVKTTFNRAGRDHGRAGAAGGHAREPAAYQQPRASNAGERRTAAQRPGASHKRGYAQHADRQRGGHGEQRPQRGACGGRRR